MPLWVVLFAGLGYELCHSVCPCKPFEIYGTV